MKLREQRLFDWGRPLLLVALLLSAVSCISSPISDAYSAYLDRDVPGLMRLLAQGEDWVAEDSALYLGYLGAPSAAEALHAELETQDRSPMVYSAIVVALGRLRQPESVPIVVKFLQRASEPQERVAVAMALGQFCAPSSRTTFEELRFDADVLVSRTARAGLARCWPEAVQP